MKKIILILVFFTTLLCYSQHKIHFDCSFKNQNKKGCNYAIVNEDIKLTQLDYYNCIGLLVKTQHFSSDDYTDVKNLEGEEILYNYDGSIFSKGSYKMGKKDGLWISNYRDSSAEFKTYQAGSVIQSVILNSGQDTSKVEIYNPLAKTWKMLQSRIYKNGVINKIIWYNYQGIDSMTVYIEKTGNRVVYRSDSVETEIVEKGEIQKRVEIMPTFKGESNAFGDFINDNLNYPKNAAADEICGVAHIRFVIDSDGTAIDFKLDPYYPSVDPDLEKEALRLMMKSKKMWNAGLQMGQPVRVVCTIPIEFLVE